MKALRVILFFAISLVSISISQATEVTFSKETFTLGSTTLPYRKADISGSSDKASLIIYLHGGSSKGNDNETQLNEPGIESITSWLVKNNHKAIFVVPQCPKDKSWLGTMLPVVKALLQTFLDRGVADEHQVYIFGGSMGGTGTWNMLSSFPNFFAAAMPVAGNPSGLKAENVKETPLYTVMGTADVIMKISNVEAFLTEIDAYDADYRFDIEEGWTHEDVCKQSYTDSRLTWVFSHTKSTTNGIDYTTTNTTDSVTTVMWYNLSGQLLPQVPQQRGIYIKKQLLESGRMVTEKVFIP